MSRGYDLQCREKKVTNRLETTARIFIDPKSCACVVDDAISEEIEEEKITLNESCTPKASIETIEKPEVNEIEISIFLERIVSLFRRFMKKLELVAALPIILRDPKVSEIVSKAETKIIKDTFNEDDHGNEEHCDNQSMIHPEKSADMISQRSSDDSETSSKSACSFDQDESASKIHETLQILDAYTEIREMIKASRKNIAPQSRFFLQHMNYFIEHCIKRIRSTPVEEQSREQHFRNIWRENHKAQQDIDALVGHLESQRSSHHDRIKTIESQYRKDYEIVEKLNKKCIDDMKTTVVRSERKQITEHKYSQSRQNDLSQYLAISKNKLGNLRDTNLKLEQEIRSKRFKVSSQLLGQIGKFDAEVGERYRILEQLTKEFELDRQRKKTMDEEIKIQSEICNAFLEEMERKNLAILRERVDNFVKNRATRIIQRWWRPIFQRLKRKKKRKPKRKKK